MANHLFTMLCLHISLCQQNNGNQKKHGQKNSAAQEESPDSTSHHILGAVGVHTHNHQGVGLVQSVIFADSQQTCHASCQRNQHWQGKIADDHGQQELQRNDGKSSNNAPE